MKKKSFELKLPRGTTNLKDKEEDMPWGMGERWEIIA